MSQLQEKDPNYARAFQDGLTWNVTSREAVRQFPDLPVMVQSAMNTGSQLARPEQSSN